MSRHNVGAELPTLGGSVGPHGFDNLLQTRTENQRGEQWARGGSPGACGGVGITLRQLAIGWILSQQPQFVPTLGIRTIQQLDAALAATALTAEQCAAVEAVRRAVRSSARASSLPKAPVASAICVRFVKE